MRVVLLEVDDALLAHRLAVVLDPVELVTGYPETWDRISAIMIGISPSGSVNTLARLRSEHPELPVIALLDEPIAGEWRRSLMAGASSVVSADSEPSLIVEVIDLTLRGFVLVPHQILAALIIDPAPRSKPPINDSELQILRDLAEGTPVAEIAHRLSYSDRQLRRMLAGVYSKLGVRNKLEALIEAARRGILS